MSQKFASATTLAGRRRQVWEGRAQLTGPNGLSKSQLTQNRQGKIVSLAKSSAAGLSGGARRRKMKLTEFYDLENRKRVTVAKKNIKKMFQRMVGTDLSPNITGERCTSSFPRPCTVNFK